MRKLFAILMILVLGMMTSFADESIMKDDCIDEISYSIEAESTGCQTVSASFWIVSDEPPILAPDNETELVEYCRTVTQHCSWGGRINPVYTQQCSYFEAGFNPNMTVQ